MEPIEVSKLDELKDLAKNIDGDVAEIQNGIYPNMRHGVDTFVQLNGISATTSIANVTGKGVLRYIFFQILDQGSFDVTITDLD